MDIKEYLLEALSTYQNDPADSPFQRGYLYALLALANECEPAIYETFKQLEAQCTNREVQ